MPAREIRESQLPNDVDAEEAVLGSILIDSDAIMSVKPLLTSSDFFRERNGWVYAAMLECNKQDMAINQITVASRLEDKSQLEEIGGPAYLSYLVSRVPTPLHAEAYAEIVRRTSARRRLIDTGGRIAALGFEGEWPEESVVRAKSLLDNLAAGAEGMDFRHIMLGLEADSGSEEVGYVPTGFAKLDRLLLGGLPKQGLAVLAGETTVGKSATGLAVCQNAAAKGYDVAIVSLEMSERQLVSRMQYSLAGVDRYNIRYEDEEKLQDAKGVLYGQSIWIYDKASTSFDEIRSRVLSHKLKHGIDLLLYDYIGLESGVKAESEVLRRAAVTRTLRALAKDINAAVLAISPLSRDAGTGRRKLSRLAWTAELEYHPDVIMFLEQMVENGKPVDGKLELDVIKQRTGRAGVKVSLGFNRSWQRVKEL